MSTAATTSIGDTAAAVPDADLWFQLYMPADHDAAAVMVDAAAAAGCRALCLTVDTPMTGFRERDVRNRMSFPPNVVADEPAWADRPDWTAAYLAGPPAAQPNVTHVGGLRNVVNVSLSWRDLEWLRARWTARSSSRGSRGATTRNGLWTAASTGSSCRTTAAASSTACPAPWCASRRWWRPSPPTIEVLVDGGVRRGIDVVKALALGARAVLVGRPACFALAVGGSDAVLALLEQFRADIDRTLAILGCPSVDDLDATFLGLS